MKQQIIDLWKVSFGDTEDFIQLFFDRVYKDEDTLVIRQHGKVVSALQILPYEMTYCGTIIPVGYIYGVCTLPSERGKGFMKRLILQALDEMWHRGYALAILIPATPGLFDLYSRYEFVNAFDYSTEEIYRCNPINKSDTLFRIVSSKDLPLSTIYAYYRSKQLEHDCSILHSAVQFETICYDRILGGGEIWATFADEQLAGLVFTDPVAGDTLSIREIMYNDVAIKNQLVQSVLNHHQLQNATLRIPPIPSNSIPYGMARIINKAQMIERFKVQVSGIRGQYIKSPFEGEKEMSSVQDVKLPDFIPTDIPILTQTLLNYAKRYAYMNLMLD